MPDLAIICATDCVRLWFLQRVRRMKGPWKDDIISEYLEYHEEDDIPRSWGYHALLNPTFWCRYQRLTRVLIAARHDSGKPRPVP